MNGFTLASVQETLKKAHLATATEFYMAKRQATFKPHVVRSNLFKAGMEDPSFVQLFPTLWAQGTNTMDITKSMTDGATRVKKHIYAKRRNTAT